MEKNEITIRKPSAMIQTNVKELTLTQRKIINYLVHVIQKTGDQRTYTISLVELKSMCGISSMGNDNLKNQIRKLTDVKIEYNYLNKDKDIWGISVLLAGVEIMDFTGFAEIAFSPFIQKKILDPKIYSPFNILLVSNLKSSYTIILYEFLRDYLNSPKVPRLEIQQFRNLLGVDKEKHSKFKYFKRDVLNVAVNEINEKTDIKCSYTLIKTNGNRYSHIHFKVKKNESFQKKFSSLVEENNLHLFSDKTTLPKEVLEVLPEKYQINSIYSLIEPYLNDLDFLISNIEYANKNCKENYPAYLKLALKNDYAQGHREVKEKKDKIVQDKKDHIQEKKNQEKLLKQKAWDYYYSLPEGEQVNFRSDAEEKMSAALKIVKIPERKNDIITAQIEKDLIVVLMQGRKI